MPYRNQPVLVIENSGNAVNVVGIGIVPVKTQVMKDTGKYQKATG
jgi:hypothetical protein